MSGRYKEINALLLFLLLPPANCVQSHRLKVRSILIVNLTRFSLFPHSAQRSEARQRLNLSTSQRDLSPSHKDHFEPLQPCLTSLTQRKINCTALWWANTPFLLASEPVFHHSVLLSGAKSTPGLVALPRLSVVPPEWRYLTLPPNQHSHLLTKPQYTTIWYKSSRS